MKPDKIMAIELLTVLLVINYMVVTVIFKDNIVLKYLRDIVLLSLFGVCLFGNSIKKKELGWLFFIIILLFAFANSNNYKLALVSFRKYVFPIIVIFSVERVNFSKGNRKNRFFRFVLVFFGIISFWGIFQAWVLGDGFLKRIGYAVSYKYGYGREMLNYSFYFGGLGIQRVVSTLSNSNVCGLVLGETLVFSAFFYPYIKIQCKNLCLIIIIIGYILTFSRSNYLAIIVVTLFVMYPYIPKRQYLCGIVVFGFIALVVLGFFQGKGGIVYKFWGWVVSTLNMTDTSAAGRSEIWSNAFTQVMNQPLGMGYGHVGALAANFGAADVFDCENSYLAIGIDCGICGLLVYLINLISKIWWMGKASRKNGNKYVRRAGLCGKSLLLYMMIVMFFSNHIYDMEAIAIVFMYVGFCTSIILKEA